MGPLTGLRVIELAGQGPGPFCAMLLADLGADVLRIDRPAAVDQPMPPDYLIFRGRRSAALDLKHPDAVATVLDLVEKADVLIEGFRPGVVERLGVGPEVCLARNPALIYGRMTGWGQDGMRRVVPGHDINYIAVTGALDSIRRVGEAPVPPLNLVGDFGGGGMLLAAGVLAALWSAKATGTGQVVDAAMVDGAALLMAGYYGWRDLGELHAPGTNILDTGAPYYDVYECADGRYVSIGAIEPQFWATVVRVLGLEGEDLGGQNERERWPEVKARVAAVFKTRTRDEWVARMDGEEACFSPVLTIDEARADAANLERRTFVDVDGVVQPAAAPRFSATPAPAPGGVAKPGEHTRAALADWGIENVDALLASGAAREAVQAA